MPPAALPTLLQQGCQHPFALFALDQTSAKFTQDGEIKAGVLFVFELSCCMYNVVRKPNDVSYELLPFVLAYTKFTGEVVLHPSDI